MRCATHAASHVGTFAEHAARSRHISAFLPPLPSFRPRPSSGILGIVREQSSIYTFSSTDG